jgi:hypothetical protein
MAGFQKICNMPRGWHCLLVTMSCRAEACAQTGVGHMEHLLFITLKTEFHTETKTIVHIQTYVYTKYFYFLQEREEFLTVGRIILKQPVQRNVRGIGATLLCFL